MDANIDKVALTVKHNQPSGGNLPSPKAEARRFTCYLRERYPPYFPPLPLLRKTHENCSRCIVTKLNQSEHFVLSNTEANSEGLRVFHSDVRNFLGYVRSFLGHEHNQPREEHECKRKTCNSWQEPGYMDKRGHPLLE